MKKANVHRMKRLKSVDLVINMLPTRPLPDNDIVPNQYVTSRQKIFSQVRLREAASVKRKRENATFTYTAEAETTAVL